MRIKELFESQYQVDCYTEIIRQISEIRSMIQIFNSLVAKHGWQSAENDAKVLLSQQSAADSYLKWMLTTPKLKASYAKLQEVRKQLEDKINSGV